MRILKQINLLIVMMFMSVPAFSAEVCSPFEATDVAPELVDSMVDAADKGRLYRIEQGTSQIGFCVNIGGKTVRGHFGDVVGGLALQPGAHVDGQALVLIKSESLDTGSRLMNAVARGENFFEADAYPDILFVSRGFEWVDARNGRLYGDLKMHGKSRPVTFSVSVTRNRVDAQAAIDRITIKASTAISRADFGMDRLAGVVDDEVRLCLSINAMQYEGRRL